MSVESKRKRIKLVVSDLHLGVGRTLDGGQLNSLEEFSFDEKFVEFLHYYSHGSYEDFDVELIMNGDIFNYLQVDFNGHFLTVLTESISLDKTKRIVEGHPEFFEAIRKFVKKEGNSLTIIVGNHDQGLMWPGVREYLNNILEFNIRFKNIVYFFDGVHIEHGNMHEAANRFDPRKFFLKKDLPEPILNLPFGSHFFVEYVLKIKERYPHIDKVRPFNRMLRWALFNETVFTIVGFFSLVKYFFKALLGKDPHRSWPFKRIVKVFVESAVFPDLGDAARKILRSDKVHTVIFGHTHVYQYRQFGLDKEYFNTGTWTDITSLDVASLGRITKLTYVILEYIDEANDRPRGRLKEWHGYHRIEENVALS